MVDVEKKIRTCKRKLSSIQASVLDMDKFICGFSIKVNSLAELKVRKSSMIQYKTEFEGCFDKLLELLIDDELSPETLNINTKFLDEYFRVMAKMELMIEQLDSDKMASTNNQASSQSLIKLPELKMPMFDGKYETWLNFKETFNTVIITRSDVSWVAKIEYLKNQLVEDLRGMVSGVEPSEAGFNNAWTQLCDRFDNKRIIIESHIKEILNLPAIVRESATELRKLLDTVTVHLRSLNVLGQPVEHWDILLVYMVISRLDPETIKHWHNTLGYNEIPTWSKFSTFLQGRARTLEAIESSKQQVHPHPQSVQKPTQKPFNQQAKATSKQSNSSRSFAIVSRSCQICSSTAHNLRECEKYHSLSPKQRFDKVNELRLCRNCLGAHMKRNCESKNVCRSCKQTHHSSLHDYFSAHQNSHPQQVHTETPQNSSTSTNSNSISSAQGQRSEPLNSNSSSSSTTAHCNTTSNVLLATAIINVIDARGSRVPARALLDSASQSNFISESLIQTLGLKKHRIDHTVFGVNATTTNVTGTLSATISSLNTDYTYHAEFLCVPRVTNILPASNVDISSWELPAGIQLADPSFHKPGKIDVLLGADIFWRVLGSHTIDLGPNHPVVRETTFGYVIAGRDTEQSSSTSHATLSFVITNDELNRQLKAFWEIENCILKPALSKEQQQCESHFNKTHNRDSSGRYTVKLPRKAKFYERLGQSENIARNRFLSLERRLQQNPVLKQMYAEFISEYIALDHMQEISALDSDKPTYFIPHHSVEKPDSTTTKLRVVFDASCPTSTGYSLNDLIMVGPPVQQELLDIILRFRTHPYVLTGDIEKMYRQVQVHPDDQQLQLIFWRNNQEENLKIFKLKTVTYGIASAPYLATKVLRQIVTDEGTNFPLAAQAMVDFYVDDILTGGDNLQQLQETKIQLMTMLSKAGMKLRKFSANHPALIEDLNPEDLEKPINFYDSACNEIIKTLGLVWEPTADVLQYKPKHITVDNAEFTKRRVLSIISSVFDPLGLLSPFIIQAKLLMQRTWLLQLNWDNCLPDSELQIFSTFINDLPHMSQLQIPRCVMLNSYQSVELHGFADSSILAYGAVVYIRCIATNEVTSQILCSKSRVCPLNKFTLAKMELCAAVLLSELVHRVTKALHHIKFTKIVLWSDSTITLSWIHSQPNLLKTFESHRVATIQGLTSDHTWRHIRSAMNPADFITRGQTLNQLINNALWWNGPAFLMEPDDKWPKFTVTATSTSHSEPIDWLFLQCSDFLRLVKSIGYWIRAAKNSTLAKENRLYGKLTVNEFLRAKYCIIRLAQQLKFPNEIHQLKKGKEISSSSSLRPLTPIIDENGLLRVGGRLHNANMSTDSKHPIILPSKHPLSTLIARHVHESQLHLGPQSMLYIMRQEYWPLNGKRLSKNIVNNCVRCFRTKPKITYQLMGNLPMDRVTPNSPFTIVGLDYCGPFLQKNRNQRNGPILKSWIAVFVCFATKAVHLDVVSDLSSECFLQALSRFVAHHGKPSEIHCDNGKTFVGANSELKSFQTFLNKKYDEIISALLQDSIEFKFIPPYSPSMGGLWESVVRSTKYHLKRVTNEQKLTFEELITLCADIEACLNSRPLTTLSDDPNDPQPLSAGHFLIGRPINAINRPSYTDTKLHLLSRWQYIQRLVQSFWQRWSVEYLNTLQERKKWARDNPNLKTGDIVLVQDDNLPPTKWMTGIIDAVHPGADNKVRVVSVKTKGGITKRNANRVCKLPAPLID